MFYGFLFTIILYNSYCVLTVKIVFTSVYELKKNTIHFLIFGKLVVVSVFENQFSTKVDLKLKLIIGFNRWIKIFQSVGI